MFLTTFLLVSLCANNRVVGLHLQRELEVMPASAAVCTTEERCRHQFIDMNVDGSFVVGDFPTKGCFSKGSNVYFGTGSTSDEDLAETDLPGTQERIWCANDTELPLVTTPTMEPTVKSLAPSNSPVGISSETFFFDITNVPTIGQQSEIKATEEPPSDGAVCLTEEQCEKKFLSMKTGGDFIVGSFPTKGCFSKNNNIYFGTGSITEADMSDTELPGSQERIWCDKGTSAPTTISTLQPTLMPVTASPTVKPTSLKPVMVSPGTAHLSKPSTLAPQINPTAKPISVKPATMLPNTINPTSRSPSSTDTGVPSSEIDSNSPTLLVNRTPSSSPVEVSLSTETPSLNPSQLSNGISSLIKPTSSPTKPPNTSLTKPTSSPTKSETSITIFPFVLTLQSDSDEEIDMNELNLLVSRHLKETIQATFSSVVVSKLDTSISQILNENRRMQQTGLLFESDNTTTTTTVPNDLNFEIIGIVYLKGQSVPSAETVNSKILEAFEGENADEFVRSLENAEDPGLQMAKVVGAEAIKGVDDAQVVENRLDQTDEGSAGSERLSLLAIVFGVGLLLVAMHVMKTRRGRKIDKEQWGEAIDDEEDDYDDMIDEESPSESQFPTYIEVQRTNEKVDEPWFDGSCFKPWFFSSESAAKESVSDEIKPTELEAAEAPNASHHAARDIEIASIDKSKGLSEALSVFPNELQSLSGESEGEKNHQLLHEWELCGGCDVEHRSASNNDTSSSSLDNQNRVSGTVWGENPSG